MPADRTFLFAILAMQNELVAQQELLSALRVWVHSKDRPLGELLEERGAVLPDDRRLLEALVGRQVERHGSVGQCLAAFEASGGARQLLADVADQDVRTSLGLATRPLPAAGHPSTAAPAATLDYAAAPAGQRFRVLRPHARGGL